MKLQTHSGLDVSASPAGTILGFPFSPAAMLTAVLLVSALAGTLDIIAAHLHMWAATGRFPTDVFKVIAGGALGLDRARSGGAEVVALGVFFHYFISFAFTLFFFALYPRMALLRRNAWVIGSAYGLFNWVVMNYLVLPLSALPWRAPNYGNKHTYLGWVVIALVFGVPIALGARRFYGRQNVPNR